MELEEKNRKKEVVKALILMLDLDEVASKDEEYIKKFFEMNPEVVTTLLTIDAVALAEDLTGKSWKEDENVGLTSLGLQMKLSRFKELAMRSLKDTHYGMSTEEFIGLLTEKGFQLVYLEEFTRDSIHNHCKDQLNVFFHRGDGVLLIFDTYNQKSVNGGVFHYCWTPVGGELSKRYDVTSSGGWESISEPDWRKTYDEGTPGDLYWRGNHDCREGMFRDIQRLKEAGTLLSPWPSYKGTGIDLPISVSVDYEKAKEAGAKPGDYTLIDAERIRRYNSLPEDVRALLNFTFKTK